MDRPEKLIRVLPACLHWSPDGEVRITGRRIGLFHILREHDDFGKSPAAIAKEFELDPQVIDEIFAFARQYEAAVRECQAQYQAELDRQFAPYRPRPAAEPIQRSVAQRQAEKALPKP
jgi:uncharacterized protein (DUF433 family)